jgi:hypothetical protein
MDSQDYLSIEQLAEHTPWSPDAIRRMISRDILKRGEHYFQPRGRGSQLIFKWRAIVALIEGTSETKMPAQEEGPDVEGATEALRGLLPPGEARDARPPLAAGRRRSSQAAGVPDRAA